MKRKISLRKKKNQSTSIETSVDNSASHPKMETPTPSASVLRKRCSDTSIKKFKQAYCLGDLSVLIISGIPTHDELVNAWEELLSEYANQIRNEDSSHIIDLSKEIGLLQHHIIYVEEAVKYLRIRYDQDMVDEMILIGYEFLQQTEDIVDWNKQLNRCISLCKTKIFDLEELQEQYKRINKTTEGKKLTDDDFNKNVMMVSKYQGYRIDQDTTMMDEYISIFNNFLYENNLIKKQNGR